MLIPGGKGPAQRRRALRRLTEDALFLPVQQRGRAAVQPQRPDSFPPAKEQPAPAEAQQELHIEAKPTEVAADYHAPTQEEVRAQIEAQKNTK